VDATFASGLGRLVNDSEHKMANCLIKKIEINGQPRLAIYAKRDLNMGEELRYDYGVKDLPWRKRKGNLY
ncbi:N-lysine methyltransferase SETD8-like, partial [Paramuricea clavata]